MAVPRRGDPLTTPAGAAACGVVGRVASALAAAANLTEPALSKASGVPADRLAALLRGHKVVLAQAPADVEALARALGVEPETLWRPPAYTSVEVAAAYDLASSATVVDWIRNARIHGTRAPGGHYMVPAGELVRLAGLKPPARKGGKQPHPPAGTVGAAIGAAMEAAGLLQIELVRLSGVPQSRMSVILRGRSRPTIGQLDAIAGALNTTPETLVGPEIVEALRAEERLDALLPRGRTAEPQHAAA